LPNITQQINVDCDPDTYLLARLRIIFITAKNPSAKRRPTGWNAGVRFPVGIKDFSSLHKVHTDSGAYPASYSVCAEDYLSATRRHGFDADNSLPFSAEIENGGTVLLLPHMSSWRGAKLIKQRDKFTSTLQQIILKLMKLNCG
jgi:hypothetical protein